MEMEEEFKSRVVGVDLSSDRTTYAIVDIRGRIIASSYFETDKYPDINDYVSKLTDEIINLVEANGYQRTQCLRHLRPYGQPAQSALEGQYPPGCHDA